MFCFYIAAKYSSTLIVQTLVEQLARHGDRDADINLGCILYKVCLWP
jgi:hypothetical protein